MIIIIGGGKKHGIICLEIIDVAGYIFFISFSFAQSNQWTRIEKPCV